MQSRAHGVVVSHPLSMREALGSNPSVSISSCRSCQRGYGATVARLTPDQKVGSSNLSGLTFVLTNLAFARQNAPREARTPDLEVNSLTL